MQHNMQICTVCGYDNPCLTNNEDIVTCEDAEFRQLVTDLPTWKIAQNLDTMLNILIECQKEIDEEEDEERQEDIYNDPGSVSDRAYEEARDMDAEAEENGYMRD